MPSGLTLEDLNGEYNARPRNPKIANACFKGGYMDVWGHGSLKIIQACKEAGLTEPLLEKRNGGIAFTRFKKEFGKQSANIRNKLGKNSEVN